MATAMTSYREASWTKSRTFEITPDSVIVRNWGFAGRVPESEVILLLAELSPQVSGRSWMKGDDQHTVLFGISARDARCLGARGMHRGIRPEARGVLALQQQVSTGGVVCGPAGARGGQMRRVRSRATGSDSFCRLTVKARVGAG